MLIVLKFGKYAFTMLGAFLVTFLLTPIARRLALRFSLVDYPEARRVHHKPTATGGGIAVFVGFHTACAATFLLPWPYFEGRLSETWWWHFLIVSSALLVLGLVDDARDIRPRLKLLGQIAVALLAFFFGMRAGNVLNVRLPLALDLAVTVFWFLAIINAFNLIDGMDGLATGLAAIAAAGLSATFLFRHEPGDTMVMLGFVGACLAFLRYNFHPARIFLGDAGSMFLGLVMAAVPLSTNAKGTLMASLGVPLLAVGVPVFDTMLAVWRRSVRRAIAKTDTRAARADGKGDADFSLAHADLDHLHHRLARRGLSQRSVATWLYGLNAALVTLGLLLVLYRSHSLGILLVAVVAAVYVIVRHLAHIELWDSGRMIVNGLRRPPARVLPFLLYPPADLLILGASSLSAILIMRYGVSFKTAGRLWVAYAPVWIGISFLSLLVTGTYKRVWSRARVSEYVILVVSLLASTLLAGGVTCLYHASGDGWRLICVVLYGLIAVPLVAGIRTLPRVVQDAFAYARREQLHGSADSHNILLYGAGYRATLFLRAKSFDRVETGRQLVVVGFIDDDSNLHHRLVHGYPVLGGRPDLERIIARHVIHELVIAAELPESAFEEAATFAAAHGLRLSEWCTELRPLTLPTASQPDA